MIALRNRMAVQMTMVFLFMRLVEVDGDVGSRTRERETRRTHGGWTRSAGAIERSYSAGRWRFSGFALQVAVALEERFALSLSGQNPVEMLSTHTQPGRVRNDADELDSSFRLAFV